MTEPLSLNPVTPSLFFSFLSQRDLCRDGILKLAWDSHYVAEDDLELFILLHLASVDHDALA